jgi:hypothetical protein
MTDAFIDLARQYAAVCIERRGLKRQLPQCIYFQQWKADLSNWMDVPPSEIERPCYMQSVRTAADQMDPLPMEERCEPCQQRDVLESLNVKR